MNKRLVFITLIVLAGLALAACGGGSEVTERPAVRLQVGDQTYEENVYQYCWPETKDNLACDVDEVAAVQPMHTAQVGEGEAVHFVVEGDAGAPTSLSATLLDFDQTQPLGTDGAYTVDLQQGSLYRVRIDAQYDDVEGKPAFVSYIFGLQVVGSAVAAGVTPEPGEEPSETPAPTEAATETPAPTQAPTETRQPTKTLGPVTPPPQTVTAARTPAPTSPPAATVEPTATVESAGIAPVEDTPSPEPPGDLGMVTMTGTVRVSSGGTTVPVTGAQVSYDHASMARPERSSSGTVITDTAGQFMFDAIMLHDTDSVRITAEAPGYVSQTVEQTGLGMWQAGGAVNFVLMPSDGAQPVSTNPPATSPTTVPTQAPLATAVPTSVVPTATLLVTPGVVPSLMLKLAGREYQPVGYQYCYRVASGERVCVELPATASSAERLNLLRGASGEITFSGPRPSQVEIFYLSDSGLPTGQPETRPGDNIVLFAVTAEPGTYILSIQVTWGDEDATYFFRVAVTD